MTKAIETAAFETLALWQGAFNAGDPDGCAECYEEDALMVATPFGEFRGRAQIRAFWADLISKGFSDVAYSDTRAEVQDDASVVISSNWTMNNAHGRITKELWVMQDDGTALLREDRFEALG